MFPPAEAYSLYEAAEQFATLEAWDHLADNPPLVVELGPLAPRKSAATMYATILGNLGLVEGIVFFYSERDYNRLVSGAAPWAEQADWEGLVRDFAALLEQEGVVSGVTGEQIQDVVAAVSAESAAEQDALAVFFDPETETNLSYLDWLEARQIPITDYGHIPIFTRTRRDDEPRLPNKREVVSLTYALRAVTGFLRQFRAQLFVESGTIPALEATIDVGGGHTVRVYREAETIEAEG